MRQAIRILGGLMIVAGLLSIAWALLVWQWQDPITRVYTQYQQRKLASSYKKRFEAYPVPPAPAANGKTPAEKKLEMKRLAQRYRTELENGSAFGRLKVPRLGLNVVIVTGTDSGSLKKGPGWYRGTFLPGQGQLIYIAGHRTTYSAPFSSIDSLKRGDQVRIEMPYGAFIYKVGLHKIVPDDDLARLETRGHEVVALQACHPRFFATQRYIVYAYPVRVEPRNGPPYSVAQGRVPVDDA